MTDAEKLVSRLNLHKMSQLEGEVHLHVPSLGGSPYTGLCGVGGNVASFADWDIETIPKERMCKACLDELESAQAIGYIGGLFG
mgnify:FL=1